MAAAVSSAPATDVPSTILPQVPFPATWKASFGHWWSQSATSGTAAQNALLKRGLQGSGIQLRDYDGTALNDEPVASSSSSSTSTSKSSSTSSGDVKVAQLRRIDLGGHDRFLNVLEVGTPLRKPNEHTFVVLHGYGGAFAFYWQNLQAMCGFPNTRVYYLDMPGMGLSSRPRFPNIKIKGDANAPENVKARVTQAEDFFINSFEDFAKKEKLENFTMIGHSLGGYLSTAYAIRKPERINKLILISPVGIPKSPYHNDEEEEEKMGENRMPVERELDDSQQQAVSGKTPLTSSSSSSIASSEHSIGGTKKANKNPGFTKTGPKTWWGYLWEANISPFAVVRNTHFMGPKIVSRYAARRFALFESDVQSELFSYLYGVYREKGSGEYCLAHILSPGAFARWPLITRIKHLSKDIPVSFAYGSIDWMSKEGGREICKYLKEREDSSTRQKENARVYINDHAGHWTFLDNPEGMNDILRTEMKEAIDAGNKA